MCARIQRTKERHSTKQNIIRIKLALNKPASLLQVFKITTVSFVAQLIGDEHTDRGPPKLLPGQLRKIKFWQQLLQCRCLFQIHMSTISALKAHFPTIHHHHLNMNLRCSKLYQTLRHFDSLESWEKMMWCHLLGSDHTTHNTWNSMTALTMAHLQWPKCTCHR